MRNIHLAETGFTGQASCTIVRYSVTNNGVQSNNQFPFQ
jgi:hypothetical protein